MGLNYINQNAKDLFELKENDNSSKIINQLKQFNLVDNIIPKIEIINNLARQRIRQPGIYRF